MNRRKPALQSVDIGAWPTVAYTEFDEAARRAFERRRQALEQYVAGASIKTIEQTTGVNRRQLYRWLERAMQAHPDGRPFGFRALVHYTRITQYARVRDVHVRGERGSCGAAGALSQLFERYPALAGWLLLQVKQRKIVLEQIHTDGRLRTRLRGLQALHDDFLRQCRAVGLTAANYPFNTAGHAIRSLSRRLKAELLNSFGTAARAAGASHLKGLPRTGTSAAPIATRPYQVVEFDGHRLDIRLKVVVRDPLGFEHEFEMERVWLLVMIDVCTRAVLGYHIALAREYSRYDVIKTLENALEPHRPRSFTIPGLTYGPRDGFPSQRLPELAYATWESMKLDNAKANLANETLTVLCEFIGCLVDAGPRYSPDERPYIERFFGTIASRLSSRLPGYTGSHPRDLRRALADPKGDLRLYVSIGELEELVEYAIAGYNGMPHSGLNNATPLEAIEYFVRGRGTLVTWLADQRRRTLCLMQSARRCRVRAYLDQGVRPHINLHGVRYTNGGLATSTHLIGHQLLIYMNANDLRSVRAFLADGTELGVLDAQGAWRVVPHNLKLRQEIRRQAGKRRHHPAGAANPIETYVKEKVAQAKKTRKAATELAHAMRLLAAAPTTRTPPGPPRPTEMPIAAQPATPSVDVTSGATLAEPSPRAPARPRKLSIGTGQVF
ncbi:putative transposase [Cupriavidus metallidurans]|uniref:DDE-type integrase/transposase/recombinase n=1 Tax=Cupriavidus TaxID=106589 RepID=UPI00049338FF|nr:MULTISPECIES: DDE-type integrase/transposase/recombinase [Cupriavidus]AVA33661.1 integrase [Cupriavidus metallidurans]MCA3193845.1 DDE-type integrase/transposase/recombinase [Cupriavidus sp.]MCA3198274.1 DDE-type integrase/transposase/recombinase [Cupriavidus sp.]MCA3232268.1 DDE-type integrase/transposase/recombinase [Cupriavidus sp.]MDE4920321.1 DDE-type integrase/transposase/recombinase [Cupriavidus metallidurans]